MGFAAALILLASSTVTHDGPSVTVVGPTGEVRKLEVADLQKLPAKEVRVTDPHGKATSRYRGVPLTSVLALVGTPFGESLRGKQLALHVRVEAADGYAVTFSLGELDAAFGNTEAWLAYEMDDKPLDAEHGPFRLVVPTDKRGGRWVRQLLKVRVLE